MDFDDLDDVEEEAPPPAPAKKEYKPIEYFPPIPRNFRLPDFSELPEQIVKLLPEKDLHLKARPKVCIRAFVFYGAGDTWYAWANLAATAPMWCEVAVHEWPSHGSRAEEDCPRTAEAMANDAFRAIKPAMDQHAKGGRIDGAPFAFIAHSIGCLFVTALCKKLQEEMNLEPTAVIMLDRAAPHIPLHSEYGQKYRDESPWDFMKDYNAMVWNTATSTATKDKDKAERMIKMWVDDVKIGSDTKPIGYYKFNCDLFLFRAIENLGIEQLKLSPDPEHRKQHETRDKIMGSPPGWAMDCSPEQYEEWKEWAAGEFKLIDIKAGHVTIKSNQQALDQIWEILKEKKAKDPA